MEIARPQDAEGLTHRYRGGPLSVGAVLDVDAGDRALFAQHGRLLGVLEAGRHVLDPNAIPFLGWGARPGSQALDMELTFMRHSGTVDVDGDVSPSSLGGASLFIEACFEVEVPDPAAALAQMPGDKTLDEVLDTQLFRSLPGVVDRAVAAGFPEDWDEAAEQIAEAAMADGLGFAGLGARFAGFLELHMHEQEGGPAAARGPGAFAPGAPVLAQAADGRWSPGSIVQMQAGRIEVAWEDGSRAWVTPYQIRPV